MYQPVTTAASAYRLAADLQLMIAFAYMTPAQVAQARADIERHTIEIDNEEQERAGQLLFAALDLDLDLAEVTA